MAMSEAQRSAFEASTGSTPLTSFSVWIGIALTVAMLWSVCALVVAYKGWASGNLGAGTLGGAFARVMLIVVILMFFLLS